MQALHCGSPSAACSRVRSSRGATARCSAAAAPLDQLRFLSPEEAHAVKDAFGTPVYVYDAATLKAQVSRGHRGSPSPWRASDVASRAAGASGACVS